MANDVRDRIIDVKTIKLGDIADNPRNPKNHPKRQGEAIRGVVKEVGWAGVPLVYKSERLNGNLAFVDGHLRKREFPDLAVRVAITDLTDSEADLLLLTYDPIAQMAEAAKEKMDDLLRDVNSSEESVTALLAEMAEKAGLSYGQPEKAEEPPEPSYKEQYGVIVMCENEGHQEEVFNHLISLGYECKVVVT